MASALAFNQYDVANGLIETAVFVAVTMHVQESAVTPLMDGCWAHTQLISKFACRQHATFAQAFKTTLKMIRQADRQIRGSLATLTWPHW